MTAREDAQVPGSTSPFVEKDAASIKHTGYFTRPEFWALDEACKPIRDAFPDYGTYLVGSVMERPTYRDVDVRLILSDDNYDRLSDGEWSLIGFIFSRHLSQVTSLPVDFQVQRQTEANAAYGDKRRNPLGVREFGTHWIGDQRPKAFEGTPVEAFGGMDPALQERHDRTIAQIEEAERG